MEFMASDCKSAIPLPIVLGEEMTEYLKNITSATHTCPLPTVTKFYVLPDTPANPAPEHCHSPIQNFPAVHINYILIERVVGPGPSLGENNV